MMVKGDVFFRYRISGNLCHHRENVLEVKETRGAGDSRYRQTEDRIADHRVHGVVVLRSGPNHPAGTMDHD